MSLPVNPPTGHAPPVPNGGGRMKGVTEGEPVDGFALLLAALIGQVNPTGADPSALNPGAAAATPDGLAAMTATGGWQGALPQGGLNPAALNPAALNPAALHQAALNQATLNQAILNQAAPNPDVQNPMEAQAGPGAATAEGAAAQADPFTPAAVEAALPVEPAASTAAMGMAAPADDAAPQTPQDGLPETSGAEAGTATPGAPTLTAESPDAGQGDAGPQAGGGDPAGGGDIDAQPVRQEPAETGAAPLAAAADGAEPASVGERPLPPALESLRAERHEPARLMEAIARSVRSSPEGEYTVTLRLHPEQLGELRLELRLSGRSVTALMEVATPEARQALQARGDLLRQSLEGAGFTLSGFEVATGQQQQSARERWQALEAELTRQSLLGARPAGAPSGPATGAIERVRSAGRPTGRLDTKA